MQEINLISNADIRWPSARRAIDSIHIGLHNIYCEKMRIVISIVTIIVGPRLGLIIVRFDELV